MDTATVLIKTLSLGCSVGLIAYAVRSAILEYKNK